MFLCVIIDALVLAKTEGCARTSRKNVRRYKFSNAFVLNTNISTTIQKSACNNFEAKPLP